MSEPGEGWTRRRFLEMVGRAGGAAAVYETMTAMGLLNVPDAWAGPAPLAAGAGAGQKVLILGAGIGGLTLAYELGKAPYEVEILEASERAGGRNLTARRGTVVTEESTEHGVTHQECRFDEGLYLNLGPGRLPYHHRRALHYCVELGVPLQVYVMETTANRFQTPEAFGGEHQVNRRVANDTRGNIAELLAKAVNKGCLDGELDPEDKKNLLSLLQVFGDLGAKEDCGPYDYCGSTRSGCELPLTVYQPCDPHTKLPWKELLKSQFWRHRFYQPVDFEWQPTLFQPVGGMDQLVEGFKRQVGSKIVYHAEVREIRLLADGVEVVTADGKTRKADHCVSNIPLPILQTIKANFSPDYEAAVRRGKFAPTCKVGWQANRRFWETDDAIYGGISWINDIITQMWYPSYDYFTQKGTMTGAYNFDERAVALGRMLPAQRLVEARKGAVRLHPQFQDEAIVPQSLGLSIAWQNIPLERGGWAEWGDSQADTDAYVRLLEPDGPGRRFHIVGDQVSTLPGWQEGAMMSAEHVLEQIAKPALLRVPRVLRAPDSRRLVQGRF
jgi:monoamine oxidase